MWIESPIQKICQRKRTPRQALNIDVDEARRLVEPHGLRCEIVSAQQDMCLVFLLKASKPC